MKNELDLYLEDLKQRFLKRLLIMGYAVGTTKLYKLYVEHFYEFYRENKIKSFADVNLNVLDRYQEYIFDKMPQPARRTQRHFITGLKSFFKWLKREGIIEHNPTYEIELPKKPKPLPKNILEEKEIKRLFESIKIRNKFDVRDRVILELLYSTGIRSGEASMIKIEDVDLKQGLVHVKHSKGGRHRILPLGKEVKKWMRLYLKNYRNLFFDRGKLPWLFISRHGKRLNGQRVNTVVQYCAKRARLKKKITAHTLRHSIATHLMRRGAKIRDIQEFLGHRYLHSTQIYTRVVIGDLRQMHREYHPRG